jgi:hypothetical protein
MRAALEEYVQKKTSKDAILKSPALKPVIEPKPAVEISLSTKISIVSSYESTVNPPAPKSVTELTAPVKPKVIAEVTPLADRTLSIYDIKDEPIYVNRPPSDRNKPHSSSLKVKIGFGVVIALVVFLFVFFQTFDYISINGNWQYKSATHISISKTQLSRYDLAKLKSITQLQTLYLVNCKITNIKPLSALKNLEMLWLNYNQITDLKPLSGLKNLKKLNLEDNQITDLSPLSELKALEELQENKITGIKCICDNI